VLGLPTRSVTRSPDSQRFALRAGRGGPTTQVGTAPPLPTPTRTLVTRGFGII